MFRRYFKFNIFKGFKGLEVLELNDCFWGDEDFRWYKVESLEVVLKGRKNESKIMEVRFKL